MRSSVSVVNIKLRALKGRAQLRKVRLLTKESKMASKIRYSDFPELKEFVLDDIQRTGTTLGHGAFGVVEELKMGGTLFAGKRLHAELLSVHNETDGIKRIVKRFKEECRLMSKIHHPRIVRFLGLCFLDDSLYPMLVMEKFDVNLETVLETHKNIPFPLILHILQDIAEGLIYMHSQRPPIIHRDLTARNVLIDQRSFRATISDLGNSRLCLVDRTKFTHTLTQAPGTLSYMSPEALECKPSYDGKLDMFSFGHLALFAIIQEFPRDLEGPTYYEEGIIKGRSEVERRDKYIVKLIAKLTEDHVVTKMVFQCLHNLPQNR
jgi:serine/threonine protein kinase